MIKNKSKNCVLFDWFDAANLTDHLLLLRAAAMTLRTVLISIQVNSFKFYLYFCLLNISLTS